MSTNLHLQATRKAYSFDKSGSKVEFEVIRNFELWQTPTTVTYHILESCDFLQQAANYVAYVRKVSNTEIMNSHTKDLFNFIRKCENEGFTLEFYAM